MIFAGVLHRDDIDLAANVLGQKDNLLADYGSLHDIKRSEVGHSVYQALSRGSGRDTINGEALPMEAWLFHYDDTLADTIRTAMPGISWDEWQPKFIKGVSENATKKTARLVINYLAELQPQVVTVSTKAIKKALGIVCSEDVWIGAVRYVADNCTGWQRDGRSFRRVIATDFGFTSASA